MLNGLQKEVKGLDESNLSLLEAYNEIKAMCEDNELEAVSEFDKCPNSTKTCCPNRKIVSSKLTDKLMMLLLTLKQKQR